MKNKQSLQRVMHLGIIKRNFKYLNNDAFLTLYLYDLILNTPTVFGIHIVKNW